MIQKGSLACFAHSIVCMLSERMAVYGGIHSFSCRMEGTEIPLIVKGEIHIKEKFEAYFLHKKEKESARKVHNALT